MAKTVKYTLKTDVLTLVKILYIIATFNDDDIK